MPNQINRQALLITTLGNIYDMSFCPSYDDCKQLIGHGCQMLEFPTAQWSGRRVTLIVDENGFANRQSYNALASSIYQHSDIVGDCIALLGWQTIHSTRRGLDNLVPDDVRDIMTIKLSGGFRPTDPLTNPLKNQYVPKKRGAKPHPMKEI
jgi:hypothetical protein